MYEDAWYSFVPEVQRSTGRSAQGPGHRRRESLLQQPNGSQPAETLDALLEEGDDTHEDEDLAEAREDGLRPLRRMRSFPDAMARPTSVRPKFATRSAQATATGPAKTSDRAKIPGKKRPTKPKREVTLEALAIADASGADRALEWQKVLEAPLLLDNVDDALLAASQQEYTTYRDQLALTERHLGGLVDDTNGALQLLSSLAASFRAVEEQTTSFQSQCDDLVSEQRRLQTLADEVGTDLHYYGYLDTATRRLNAPGASRLADGEELAEILSNLDACIHFMATHETYRDAESYLARYQSLLTKALHLLELGFTARVERVATDLTKQIGATQSDAAQHALAYGRFEELLVERSYALVPNVQQVLASAYHPQTGVARTASDPEMSTPTLLTSASSSGMAEKRHSLSIYANTAVNLLQTYLQWRDQCLRPVIQKELDAFHADVRAGEARGRGSTEHQAAVETAARSLVKQSFERSYHEVLLFAKVFGVDPQYPADRADRADRPDGIASVPSVFAALRAHRSDLVNAVNVAPVAALLQTTLAGVGDLRVVCNVLGWITHEYLLPEQDYDYGDDDDDDDDGDNRQGSYMTVHSRQLAARVLAEHLWAFTDGLFEAEVARTITKAAVVPEALQVASNSVNSASSATTAPAVRRALELLELFDQAMPKERCQHNAPVVCKIVRETMVALQRAEARIKAARLAVDADLFMIKNLLVLKNELVSLEIGDLREGTGTGGPHFGQIWDALSMAQHLVGYLSSSFLPGSGPSPGPASTPAAAASASSTLSPAAAGRPGTPTMSQSLWSRAASVAGGYQRAASVVGSMTGSLLPSGGLPSFSGPASASAQDVSEQLDDALRRAITSFTARWAKTLQEGASSALGGRNVAKRERELDEQLQAAFGGQHDVVAKLKEAIEVHRA